MLQASPGRELKVGHATVCLHVVHWSVEVLKRPLGVASPLTRQPPFSYPLSLIPSSLPSVTMPPHRVELLRHGAALEKAKVVIQ